MNFTQWDMKILVSMTIALVILSLTFSNIGMAHESFNASEIPEFNISENRFDITGDFPEHPGYPSKGNLTWNTKDSILDTYQVFLKGGYRKDDTYQLGLVNLGDKENPDFEIHIYEYNASSNNPIQEVDYAFSNVSDYTLLTMDGFRVYAKWTAIENETGSPEKWHVEWEVKQQPTSGGFISRIPVIGSIADAGGALASTVGWIGSIFAWFSLWITNIAINLLVILFEGITFFISTLSWLIGSYTTLINNVVSWAKIILAIPGLLLSLEFVKITWIAIKLLPTT